MTKPLYTYPHTIENGAGERLTFLRRVTGPRGDRLEGENLVAPGAGPPMHVHFHQDEVFTVQNCTTKSRGAEQWHQGAEEAE